ncbi:MAG: hypothetical protein JNL32_08715, partial [Candidatus Kapabacteria bacterium]|nr:hypothetical protein [Candidatus Kapabacteria bacterium]
MKPSVQRLLAWCGVAIVALTSFFEATTMLAQCQPTWQFGPMAITSFRLLDGTTTIIDRTSAHDACPCPTVVAPNPNGAFATGVSGNVTPGKTYNYSIIGARDYYCQANNNYPFVWAIFVDLNNNNTFEISERLATNTQGAFANANTPATGTMTIPCTATGGALRMRVMAAYYFNPNLGDQIGNACGTFNYGEAEDYTLNTVGDMGETFPSNTAPTNLLAIGQVYSGTNGAWVNVTRPVSETAYLTYRILGPLPSTNSVYVALNPANSNDTTVPCTAVGTYNQTFSSARGAYAGANGAIDLTGTNVVPGAYRLEVSYVKSGGCSSFVAKNFYIPLQWDLSLSRINAPNTNASPSFYKYPRGVPIPLSCRVQNVGQNTVNQFRLIAEIRNSSGSLVRPADTLNYNNATGLTLGSEISSDAIASGFPTYTTNTVGLFNVVYKVELIGATDMQTGNNQLPTVGQQHVFEVQYDTELGVDAFIAPSSNSTLFVNRPIRPLVRVVNNGLADASDIPATLVIRRGTQIVYTQNVVIPDVSRGSVTGAVFPFWTPSQTGQYTACMYISSVDDAIRTNDTLCININVGDALSGTYTIGTSVGGPRNFTTILEAVNALYAQGVTGPTVFELTDPAYEIGTGTSNQPALDLTARIAGVSNVNTITFRPSLLRGLTRSSISLRLRTGNGVGILFGQNFLPTNSNAIQVTQPLPTNANPSGYITFDGGDQKSFRFMLDVGTATPAS